MATVEKETKKEECPSSPTSGQQVVTLTTSDCPISNVTVYKDRAEVSRSVETSVKPGTTEVRIAGFVEVDEDSIRVEGRGQATIAEVSLQTKWNPGDDQPASEKEKALTDTLNLLKEGERTLDAESQIKLLDRQWNVLDQFASSAAKSGQADGESGVAHLEDSYFEGMKNFIHQYRDLGKQLDAEKLDVKKKSDELKEKIKQVEKNLNELRGERRNSSKLPRECVVVLESDSDTAVFLKLSYVVYSASWVPSYDLRMNTEDGQLKVTYFGLISQNSGEDWTNVTLNLSTAEPSVGGTIPELPQTEVAIARPQYYSVKKRGGIGFGSKSKRREVQNMAPMAMSFSCEEQYDSLGMGQMEAMESAPVLIQETSVSASYEIVHQSSIPSDNSPHKVTVGIVDLKPTLTYVTVPKIVPHAFLQANVVNSSQFTFLPGQTNIFLDNSFVAKADLKAVAPQEEFECSLGVDPGVRVTYKPLVKVNSTYGILSRARVVSHEQVIELKNVHNYSVKVKVKDSLPRSCDDKIKVVLKTPHIDDKNPEKSEALLTSDNTVVWEREVRALDKTEVVLKYTIEHPAGEKIDFTTV